MRIQAVLATISKQLASGLQLNRWSGRRWRRWSMTIQKPLWAIDGFAVPELDAESAFERRFGEALEMAGIGVWDWDLITGKIWRSTNMDKINGIEPSHNASVEKAMEHLHPDDVAFYRESIQRALETAEETVFEFRVIGSDQMLRWIETRARVEKSPSGESVRMLGTAQNVTDRHRSGFSHGALLNAFEQAGTRVATLLDQMPFGVAIAEGGTGKLLFGNRRMEEIWDTPVIHSANIEEYQDYLGYHLDGRPLQPEEWPMARAAVDGESIESELIRIERRNGVKRVIEVSAAPVFDDDGGIEAVIAIFDDVTIRERIAQSRTLLAECSALLAVSISLRETIDRITAIGVPTLGSWCLVHLLDSKGELICVGTTHPELPAELADFNFDPCYPPRPDADIGPYRVLATGQTEVTDAIDEKTLERLMADPETLPMVSQLGLTSMLVTPLLARGTTLGTISYFQTDVWTTYGPDEIYVAESIAIRASFAIANAQLFDAVRSAEERFRTVFENVTDAIFVLDERGMFIQVNDAMCELTGYSRTEMIGMNASDVRDDPAEQNESAIEDLRQGGRWHGNSTIRKKDGIVIAVESDITVVDRNEGRVYLGVSRDITEQVELEQMRQDFLAMVTHDLRSPLAALRLNAQLLQRRQEYHESTVQNIVSQVDHIARLTDQLADVVRLEAGRLVLDRESAPLAETVRTGIAAVSARQATGRIRVEEPKDPIVAWIDRARVAQIVQNLVDNAIKYSPDGLPITVRLAQVGDIAQITVIDRGIGMSPETRKHLFDRFFRGSESDGNGQGLGLGLYITRMLVDAHGGTIDVEPGIEVGTVFTVHLPIDRKENGVDAQEK